MIYKIDRNLWMAIGLALHTTFSTNRSTRRQAGSQETNIQTKTYSPLSPTLKTATTDLQMPQKNLRKKALTRTSLVVDV